MKALAQIVEIDQERDRKTCLSLDQKATGANRELAQWCFDHPRYSQRVIAAWLGCKHTRIFRLRKWAASGFEGLPFGYKNNPDSRSTNKATAAGAVRHQSPLKTKTKSRPSGPTQELCTDCGTTEEHWQRSLGNLAGDAISMREFWTREFGEWKEFEVSSSLVTLAKQAARVWIELAADLTKRGG